MKKINPEQFLSDLDDDSYAIASQFIKENPHE